MTPRIDLEDRWKSISLEELEALRTAIAHLQKGRNGGRICDDAGIHPHDLKNFLRNSGSKPKWRPGIRILAFAARLPAPEIPELRATFEIVTKTARRIFEFDADDDFFYKHLEKLGVTKLKDCKAIAKQIHGAYYMYRMSPESNVILRSHITIAEFDPFDKLPHFVNRLKFGPIGTGSFPMRKAEGQVLSVNNAYVFVAFVLDNFDRPVTGYKGFELIIVPSSHFDPRDRRPAPGMFVSFSYGKDNNYEYGPAVLIRSDEEFQEINVGEFQASELNAVEPKLSLSDLEISTEGLVKGNLLTTCLSMSLFANK